MKKTEKITPPWSTVGYLTYKRTYARPMGEGTEEFEDTIDRVMKALDTQLHVGLTRQEEDTLKEYFMSLKCSVAGRFLWQLGTDTVDKLGLSSLQNCAFVVVDEPVRPFCWAMDMLALGSGVGFSIQRKHVNKLPPVKTWFKAPTRVDHGGADFVIPDSREGWVKFLGKTLKSAFLSDRKDKGTFTYSTQVIRGKGTPIKGFGGTASGPEDLVAGVNTISKILEKRSGKQIRPIDALDIMNIIAQIIVAGNVRRCLPANSLVHTRHGMVPIKDVKVGSEVLTASGYKKVLNKFEQGEQSLLTIYTQDGSFDCTANHKMAVMTGVGTYEWKTARDLTTGDRLVSTRRAIEGIKKGLPTWSYEKSDKATTCQDITIPELDGDLAWLVGALHGNGYIYANKDNEGFSASVSMKFNATTSIEEAIFAKTQLERFNVNVSIDTVKDENTILVRAMSKQLAYYMHEHIKQPKTSIVIPDFIMNNTIDIRLGYLAGIADTDGSLHNRPVKLVTTVYKDFAKQIQNLCYSCGIETRFKANAERENGWQTLYDICLVTDFSRKAIAAIPQLIKEVRFSQKDQNSNAYLTAWIKDRDLKLKIGASKTVTVRTYSEFLNESPDLIPVEITSFDMKRKDYTYDIEVEDVHEFFCEGYLTHNSAQIAIGDPDDVEYLLAKRWDMGNIPSWRAMSNNSVVCDDISELHDYFWDSYSGGGEAYGLINLRLTRECGRIGETEYPDPDVEGVNPCAEQGLANFETCCLAEIFLPNVTSQAEFLDICELLYRVNKHSLLLRSHQLETEEVVHKNMRMGIGLTGWCQATDEQKSWCDVGYKYLRDFDRDYSASHGLNTSIKLTTIKPSGTLSLLPGVTPGAHPGYARFMKRRIRIAANHDLVDVCRSHGYPIEYCKNFDGSEDYSTVAVTFPFSYPAHTVLAKDVSAVEQLETARNLQTIWSDNSVSLTVYYKKEELPAIKAYLERYYRDYHKTVSFLLHSDHGFQQAPYEEITEEEFNKLVESTQIITHVTTAEFDGVDECAGGACPIK